MKKSILYLFAMLFVGISAQAQFQEFDFDNFLFEDPLPCNPFVTNQTDFFDPWKASHGSPQITGDARNIALLRASETNFEEKTEGVFLTYAFKQGHLYEIEVVMKSSDGQTGVDVYATNGLSATTKKECENKKIPSVSDKSQIMSEPYIPSFSYNGYAYDFIPTKNYSALWILSRQVYLDRSGNIYVSHVTIYDRGVQDNQPPSAPTNLQATNVTSNSITLQWNASSDDKGVSSYEIYAGSTKITTSTSTSKTITGLASCSPYNNLKVRAVDATGNKSSFSNSVNTTTQGTVTTLSADLTSRRTYTAQDSEVRLTNGFVFRAVDASYEFLARSTGCTSARVAAITPKISKDAGRGVDYVKLKSVRAVDILTEANLENTVVYPNPFSSNITVNYSIETEGTIDLTIFNLAGHQVKHLTKYEARGVKNQDMKFDVSQLPAGIYIYHLKTGEQEVRGKLIKQ